MLGREMSFHLRSEAVPQHRLPEACVRLCAACRQTADLMGQRHKPEVPISGPSRWPTIDPLQPFKSNRVIVLCLLSYTYF